jgi:hypothetical protein
MANVQKQFDAFHAAIRLGHFDEEKILREKRDIIRDKLDEKLPEVFKRHGEELPDYYFRDQGSYELRTGTKPLDGDYDIDQGLYFLVSTDDWKDPVTLKQRVHEALDGHTKDVRIRRPCVTVFYERSGEPIYHVDIAVYADGSKNADGKSKLAKGRENSEAKYRVWEVSNPKALKEKIEERFKGNDAAQFRHVVRYLKRWRDENFSSDGNAAPLGIGLTVAAYDDFHPTYSDPIKGTSDDLAALRPLVGAILGRFADKWDTDEGKYVRRLEVKLPVEPWNNLFEQMTDNQMANLETKLRDLQTALDDAAAEVDPVEACKKLQKVFGDDFPVPEKQETAARVAPAIVSSSSSA